MKRLILHIGTHKTGSSAIQNWLEANRNALQQQGIWYASTDRPPVVSGTSHASLFWSLVRDDMDFKAERDAILKEFDASGCDTLILSNEGLSQHTLQRFIPLREFAAGFETTVVCFLRRQDYYLESMWNQNCKMGKEARPIAEFALSKSSVRRTRYVRMLNFWDEFFDVKVVDFDAIRKQGAVSTFAEMCGLPFNGREPAVNISPSMNCAAFCCFLNRRGVKFNSRVMVGAFKGDTRKFALGKVLREQILEANVSVNGFLSRRYGVVFQDDLPDEPDEPITFPSSRVLARAGITLTEEAFTLLWRYLRRHQ